jgi:hypothetical protein
MDLGVGAFAKAARLWAGDAPYGVDTPVLPNLGISLLGALPSGSKRMLRVDLSLPLRRWPAGASRGVELSFSFSDESMILLDESRDVERAREQIVGTNIFRP